MASFRKDIQLRDVNCVSGYIRAIIDQLVLPDVVLRTVLDFYAVNECFHATEHGEQFILSENNDVITKKNSGYAIAFLTNTVPEGRHRWKFKIIEHNARESHTLSFGVWNVDQRAVSDVAVGNRRLNRDLRSQPAASSFTALVSRRVKNGNKIGEWESAQKYYDKRGGRNFCLQNGDVVEMLLDLRPDRLYVCYKQNDRDFSIAFTVEKASYRAVVGAFAAGTTQLLSYECF